jgi:hypothetical protein
MDEFSYQYLSTTSNFHENTLLVIAIIIDDTGISNDEVQIIPVIDMSPDKGLGSIGCGIVRKFCDGDRNPIGILYLRGELGHDGLVM